jgi:hypothetical protein
VVAKDYAASLSAFSYAATAGVLNEAAPAGTGDDHDDPAETTARGVSTADARVRLAGSPRHVESKRRGVRAYDKNNLERH